MTDEAKALAIINRLEREKGIYLSDMDMVLRRYPLTFGVIGRQATQIERLREALAAIADGEGDAQDIARQTLEGESNDQ